MGANQGQLDWLLRAYEKPTRESRKRVVRFQWLVRTRVVKESFALIRFCLYPQFDETFTVNSVHFGRIKFFLQPLTHS